MHCPWKPLLSRRVWHAWSGAFWKNWCLVSASIATMTPRVSRPSSTYAAMRRPITAVGSL